uniref:Uncharacterized protein n=1 Tax=Arundo donax TaxID=35708 RepID=A0A0A9EQK8_ARUDO
MFMIRCFVITTKISSGKVNLPRVGLLSESLSRSDLMLLQVLYQWA